jgi:hypothetical protein
MTVESNPASKRYDNDEFPDLIPYPPMGLFDFLRAILRRDA